MEISSDHKEQGTNLYKDKIKHIFYKHSHSPFWPTRHRKFDIVQNALMKLVMEAMTLVPCKKAINQGGALLHILWLYIVKAYQIHEVNEDSAVDKQCWADNVVFTFLLTAACFLFIDLFGSVLLKICKNC